ncbi:hypothetical protein BD830_10974 [Maritimibacter alkaliphilus HTCC2654]|nr:hypothetical protein BD830_10974 [Maritimibacter alkaliphilus HTCC2654]
MSRKFSDEFKWDAVARQKRARGATKVCSPPVAYINMT